MVDIRKVTFWFTPRELASYTKAFYAKVSGPRCMEYADDVLRETVGEATYGRYKRLVYDGFAVELRSRLCRAVPEAERFDPDPYDAAIYRP